jgi:hypothetical protein
VKGARNTLVDLENLSDAELQKLQEEFQRLSTSKAGSRNRSKT